jgi:hypothetical protein
VRQSEPYEISVGHLQRQKLLVQAQRDDAKRFRNFLAGTRVRVFRQTFRLDRKRLPASQTEIQLLERFFCRLIGKQELKTHALSRPDLHDAGKSLVLTIVQHENKVHLGEEFQLHPGVGHEVASGFADVPNFPAKQVPRLNNKGVGESFATDTTA